MKIIDKKLWQNLTLPFNNNLNDSLKQQHHAAQFIALVGKYLIPQLPDDSNTNMLFSLKHEFMVGNKLPNGIHIALYLQNLILHFLDENFRSKHSISLNGKSKNQVFEELKQTLATFGNDVSKFTKELHYEIPSHDLDNGSTFNIDDSESFSENILYRHNSEIILNNIATDFSNASSVRIWPHHFDTGSYIPIEFNSKNEVVKSFGIGWAVPDSMINEPYYYLSFWSENSIDDFNQLPLPDAGEWITTGWKGGVLKLSDLIKEKTSKSQYELVKTFFHSGIKILNEHYL